VDIKDSQPNLPHFQIERMQDNFVYRAEALRRREGKTTANDFLCVSAPLRDKQYCPMLLTTEAESLPRNNGS
jgi:hypothetical protein